MLKVCTYRHFRSISTLFSYIIFQTAGVFFSTSKIFGAAVVHRGQTDSMSCPPGWNLLKKKIGAAADFQNFEIIYIQCIITAIFRK